MPGPDGETRESDHIDCKHWIHRILLTAWRDGSNWKIKRLDTGETVSSPALEVATWQPGLGDVRAYWAGDDFSLTYSNGTGIPGTFHTLPYFSHDPNRDEWWQCHWDPNKRLFVHTLTHTSGP